MYVRLGAGASTILEGEREAIPSRRIEGDRKSRELVRQHLSEKKLVFKMMHCFERAKPGCFQWAADLGPGVHY